MKHILFPLIILLSSISLHGCFSLSGAPEETQPQEFIDINLYLSRTSLNGTEFEQFKLGEEGDVYVECGEIKGGRYHPKLQKFGQVTEATKEELKAALGRFVVHQSTNKFPYDSPGDNSNLFDPGKYTFSFTTPAADMMDSQTSQGFATKIKTSLDSISEPSAKVENDLLDIATTLRASSREMLGGEPLCGNDNFFGIKG